MPVCDCVLGKTSVWIHTGLVYVLGKSYIPVWCMCWVRGTLSYIPVWCVLDRTSVWLHAGLVYVLGKRYTELHASEKKKEKAAKQEQKKQEAKPMPQVWSLHTHTKIYIHSLCTLALYV